MNVLSLFDGMSCGQLALSKAGIKVDKYYASEIDKYAIAVTDHHFPRTIQLGNINTVYGPNDIDLLIGGSPCQGFSFAGKQLNFDDPRSALFFEYVRLLKKVKPKYFLLENVRMKQEYQDVISDQLGVKPIMINSALVSAQNRVRLYWTNIPGVQQPENKGIFLKDILSSNKLDKYIITPDRVESLLKFLSGDYKIKGKVGALTTELAHSTGKNFYPKALLEIYDVLSTYRRLTPMECERLQTVSDDYTLVPCQNRMMSNTQRYKMLGNGWTVDVITHIFNSMKEIKCGS